MGASPREPPAVDRSHVGPARPIRPQAAGSGVFPRPCSRSPARWPTLGARNLGGVSSEARARTGSAAVRDSRSRRASAEALRGYRAVRSTSSWAMQTACCLPGLASGVAGRRIPWRVGALVQVLPACLVALAVGFIAVRELVSHRIGVGKGSSLVRSGSEKKDGDASRATAPRPKHPPGPQLADDRGARALVAHGRRALVAHGRFPGSASVQKSSIARLAARQSRRATPSAQEPASVAAGSTEEAPLAGARAAEERPRQGPAIAFRATAEAGATASGSAAADPRGGSPVEPSAGASGRPGRDERAASELGFER